MAGEREKLLQNDNGYSFNYHSYSYLARGVYVEQLRMWLSEFPKEQILVLKSEELYTHPKIALNRVFEFLNLPAWHLPNYKPYHVGQYPPLNAATRTHLSSYFSPYNKELSELLEMEFDW